MRNIIKYSLIFLVGGLLYNLLEIIWRGFSHISMTLAGGLSILFIFILNELFPELNIILKSIISAIFITLVEFISGYIVNIKMGLGVWNYSSLPFNLLGQISLPFSAIWFLLSIPANFVCKKLQLSLEKKPFL